MSLQKYRADKADPTCANGAVMWTSNWIGGPSYALVRNCPIEGSSAKPRTVYVTGEPDTFFSLPAACIIDKKTVRGWLGRDANDNWVFHTRGRTSHGQSLFFKSFDDGACIVHEDCREHIDLARACGAVS